MGHLTLEQVFTVMEMNRHLAEEVTRDIDFYWQHKHPLGHECVQGGFHFLNEQTLFLQLPSNDQNLGGFIVQYDRVTCCYLNTYQPRVNQYFALGHEIYHLLKGMKRQELRLIRAEWSDDERKADYFASLWLMPEKEMRAFIASLQSVKDPLELICMTMNRFKSPFKAVLIRLFELQLIEQAAFIHYFTQSLELPNLFRKFGLDSAIVERSLVTKVPNITQLIQQSPRAEWLPKSTTEQNIQLYEELIQSFVSRKGR